MHIHLPKPFHGWRELGKEVGVITLGILIALGLEQAVHWTHDRSLARETRADIREEIGSGLHAIALRRASEPCIQRRLREISAYLDAADAGDEAEAPSWVGAPLSFLLPHARFQAAQSAGHFVLLSGDDQEKSAAIYAQFDDFNEAGTREWYAWAQLRSLAGRKGRPSEADRARLRAAVQEARAADWFIRLDTASNEDLARNWGLAMPSTPSRLALFQTPSVCLPMTTPFAEGAAQAGAPRVPYPE